MTPSPTKQRLLALDVFRGLTMIAMIVVNSPNTYGELSHAYWIGVNFADIIFPFFILIVGVAISLGIQPSLAPAQRWGLMVKVLKRTLLLFLLGMLVNLFYTHFSAIRVMGVLQRIALVYCCCSLLRLYCHPKTLAYTAAGILVCYWLAVMLIPMPGYEAGHLERGINIINWFDQFMPGMQWRGQWDPEGLLSTFPAVASGLIGVLMGLLLQQQHQPLPQRVLQLFVFGCLLFAVGCLWSLLFPPIKQIWSSSFVLITAGLGALTLATLVWYTDIQQYRWGTQLAVVFGANAISAYVIHVVIEKLLDMPWQGVSVLDRYMTYVAAAGFSHFFQVALWSCMFFTLCVLPVYWLYHQRIFIKI